MAFRYEENVNTSMDRVGEPLSPVKLKPQDRASAVTRDNAGLHSVKDEASIGV